MSKKQKKRKSLPPTLKRVGIFMLDDRMGDFILSMPTLDVFASYFEGRADLYVASQHVSLAKLLSPFKSIVPYIHKTKERKSFSQFCGFLELILKLPCKRYQAVIFISGRITESTLSILSFSPRRIGLSWARRSWVYNEFYDIGIGNGHVMQSIAALLQSIGKQPPVEPIQLHAPDSSRTALEAILKTHQIKSEQKIAVIHPSAGIAHRCWPQDRFAAVADALIEQGLKVCFIGTLSDRIYIREITEMMQHTENSFFFAEPLPVLLALFERAHLVFSNESGPTHLAATTQVPIVTIFGPTNPNAWSPMRKENLIMLSKKDEHCICEDPRFCKIDWPCIKKITVEEALAALENFL